MFGLSIVKTADLNNLKARVADLETNVDGALDKSAALERKYNNLADQQQRSDKAVREQLSALAKPKTYPVLQKTHKHETDPVGAWESKQRVLEQRLHTAVKLCASYLGRDYDQWRLWNIEVVSIEYDLRAHQAQKPTTEPSDETAMIVEHKKYGTLGLLKGNHITILNKCDGPLNVGDVILNATPDVVHKFWDILPHVQAVKVRV